MSNEIRNSVRKLLKTLKFPSKNSVHDDNNSPSAEKISDEENTILFNPTELCWQSNVTESNCQILIDSVCGEDISERTHRFKSSENVKQRLSPPRGLWCTLYLKVEGTTLYRSPHNVDWVHSNSRQLDTTKLTREPYKTLRKLSATFVSFSSNHVRFSNLLFKYCWSSSNSLLSSIIAV